MRKNFHSTSDVLFKTSAVASLVSLDRSRFSVGYHWDPVRHVSDLKLASIKFPKSLIKNVNCLDYIQVTSEAACPPDTNTARCAAGDGCGGAGAWLLHPALQPRLHDGARGLGTPRHAPSQGRGTAAGSAGQHLLIIVIFGIQPGLLLLIFIFFRVQSGFFLIIRIQPGLLLLIFLRVQPGLLHVIPARGKLTVRSD